METQNEAHGSLDSQEVIWSSRIVIWVLASSASNLIVWFFFFFFLIGKQKEVSLRPNSTVC